jgi:hypothetical protein
VVWLALDDWAGSRGLWPAPAASKFSGGLRQAYTDLSMHNYYTILVRLTGLTRGLHSDPGSHTRLG